MLTTQLIEQILATIPHKSIGLIGDLFLDRYLDIDPARDEPSIETNLTAYQVTHVRSYPGALGTVMNNLAALGVGRIEPIAIIGDDGEGYELRQALHRLPSVDVRGLVIASDRRTPTYTKPMYGDRELNRLDIKNRTPTPAKHEDAVLAKIEDAWSRLDAVIVLDQVSEENCGVITTRVREHLTALCKRSPTKFVLADSREQIGLFHNICIKPNRSEIELWLGKSEPGDFDNLLRLAAEQLQSPVFCTRSDDGIHVAFPGMNATDIVRVPAYPVTGPIDSCGAGDSCSAAITAAMVSGISHEQAAAFGNLVASITIQQIGTTGTATPAQVRGRWRDVTA